MSDLFEYPDRKIIVDYITSILSESVLNDVDIAFKELVQRGRFSNASAGYLVMSAMPQIVSDVLERLLDKVPGFEIVEWRKLLFEEEE